MYIDTRLRFGFAFVEELQLLKGSGVGNNLSRLLTAATAYSGAVGGDTKIDTLRRAVAQLESTEFSATGIIVNPIDWEAIALVKTTEGEYVVGDPSGTNPAQLWGLPVVSSNSMTVGTFLVADFPQAALILDRMQPRVDIPTETEDDFLQNMAQVRAEERLGLAILRPGGLIKGTFA
ncbi:MAG: phage major capsid protein [Candidatus Eremiobacteraeota bacterium]|nr:phage major capsid protein [Candidatus Eremiobacteraeota bacterium]